MNLKVTITVNENEASKIAKLQQQSPFSVTPSRIVYECFKRGLDSLTKGTLGPRLEKARDLHGRPVRKLLAVTGSGLRTASIREKTIGKPRSRALAQGGLSPSKPAGKKILSLSQTKRNPVVP